MKCVRRASRPSIGMTSSSITSRSVKPIIRLAAEGRQWDVEAGVTVRVGLHDPTFGFVVPGEVVLLIDRDACPVRADRADPIGRMVALVDTALQRASRGTTHPCQTQEEPGSQPPPHWGRL